MGFVKEDINRLKSYWTTCKNFSAKDQEDQANQIELSISELEKLCFKKISANGNKSKLSLETLKRKMLCNLNKGNNISLFPLFKTVLKYHNVQHQVVRYITPCLFLIFLAYRLHEEIICLQFLLVL